MHSLNDSLFGLLLCAILLGSLTRPSCDPTTINKFKLQQLLGLARMPLRSYLLARVLQQLQNKRSYGSFIAPECDNNGKNKVIMM